MKQILAVILIITLSFSFSFSQNKKNINKKTEKKVEAIKEVKVNKNAPEITFEQLEYNFGIIPYKGDGSCEFKFKNTGKEALVLTNVKSSCGCTIPTWPRNPIAKKQKETIKVKYDTKRQGKFHKSITVYCNATNSPVKLIIKGEVAKPSAEEQAKLKLEREKRLERQKKHREKKAAKAARAKSQKEKVNQIPIKKEQRLPETR